MIYLFYAIFLIFFTIYYYIVAYKYKEFFYQSCKNTFIPTCNKNKIYTRLKQLEEKLDEHEYDIYRHSKLLKSYGKYYKSKKRNSAKNQEETKQKIQNIMTKNQSKAVDEIMKDRQYSVQGIKTKSTLNKTLSKKKKKKTLDKGFSIDLSGNSPEAKEAEIMVNKEAATADKDDQEDWNESLEDVDMPKGFVL